MRANNRRFLYIAIGLYIVLSPLSVYNTVALFSQTESKLPGLQMAITAVMILFAYLASRPISEHLKLNSAVAYPKLWVVAFYVVGPPALYAYYKLRFTETTEFAID